MTGRSGAPADPVICAMEKGEKKMEENEEEIQVTEEVEKETAEETEEETAGKKVLYKLFEVIGAVTALFIIYNLWNDYSQEKYFYQEIYQQAETALRRDFDKAVDLEVDEYDRDRITELGVAVCDLGEGNLRYQVYNVSVHASYNTGYGDGRYEVSPDIKVYYYDNEQNVPEGEGVDQAVPSHYHAVGVLEAFRNSCYEAEKRGQEALDEALGQWEEDW